MILSESSRDLLSRIVNSGGSIEVKGNRKSGNALARKKLVQEKAGRFVLTAAGRKWHDKN